MPPMVAEGPALPPSGDDLRASDPRAGLAGLPYRPARGYAIGAGLVTGSTSLGVVGRVLRREALEWPVIGRSWLLGQGKAGLFFGTIATARCGCEEAGLPPLASSMVAGGCGSVVMFATRGGNTMQQLTEQFASTGLRPGRAALFGAMATSGAITFGLLEYGARRLLGAGL